MAGRARVSKPVCSTKPAENRTCASLQWTVRAWDGLSFRPSAAWLTGHKTSRLLPQNHASVSEAFRAGPRGVAWEGAMLARPWGFSIDAIRCPVMLWHGEADREVTVTMARRLAARLPTVRTWFLPEEGHFSLPVRHQRAILGEIKRSVA